MNKNTIMGKLDKAIVDSSVLDDIQSVAEAVLSKYDYEYGDGLRQAIDASAKAKAQIITLLRKNPNWNEEKMQIQFSSDFTRAIDLNEVERFFDWAKDKLMDKMRERQFKVAGCTLSEINKAKERIAGILNDCNRLQINHGVTSVVVDGFTPKHYTREQYRLVRLYDRFDDPHYITYMDMYVTLEDEELYENLKKFASVVLCYLTDNKEKENIHLLDEDICKEIDAIFPDVARKGIKLSKVVNKVVGGICGLANVVDIRDASYYDNNGNWVKKEKDFGYNYQIAMVGDAINPFKIKRHTIISVNFVDFLCMSFGYKWASCMDISRGQFSRETFGNTDGHAYHGQYSGGTVSYALDPSSIIFYTVEEKYDGTEFERQPKMQRAVFALGDDAMYEGRVYPDGRDGGDDGLAGQFRVIMQKIVADALDVPNRWTIKKGTGATRETIYNLGGVAYDDWNSCPDSVMSYLNHPDSIDISERKIFLNAPQICLYCGDEHDTSEDILCASCTETEYCYRCDERISPNDYNVIRVDGYTYCCPECAEEDGYHLAVDDEEWHHEREMNYDCYENEWFYSEYEMVITNDGNVYRDSDNAEAAGYEYCANVDAWHRQGNISHDAYTGEAYYPDEYEVVIDDKTFMNEINAEAAGYTFDAETEEWKEVAA